MSNNLNVKRFDTLFSVKSSLISLYLALTFPIVFITINNLKLISLICFILGFIFIFFITNDYVITSEERILFKTSYISSLFGKKSWEIHWKDIASIKSIPTSQGSKVFYFITCSNQSFLLPQRIEKLAEFKKILIDRIDGLEIEFNYISPLWTYKLLTGISIIFIFWEVYLFLLH
tara:strand:- start:84 stop:608 length:525 start_codon:yes stop_codon:yes gene_type:complete